MIKTNKEKQEIVYLYTFPNGKMYVGKTCQPDVRCLYYNVYRKQMPVYNALKKAEENGDTVDLTYLSEYVDNKVAAGIEKHYIALYRTNISRYGNEFGYNLTDGGEGVSGYKFTEEEMSTRKALRSTTEYKSKVSASMKAAHARPEVKARHKAACNTPESRKRRSEAQLVAQNKPERKTELSEAWMGDKNPMKKLEVRAKVSAWQLVAQNKPEQKAKKSALATKQWQDPEFRANRSAEKMGDKNPAKRHENRVSASLTTQLQYHEKRLEKAGILPVLS